MMAAHASFPTIFNALNYFNNRPAATPNNLDDSDDDDTDDSGVFIGKSMTAMTMTPMTTGYLLQRMRVGEVKRWLKVFVFHGKLLPLPDKR